MDRAWATTQARNSGVPIYSGCELLSAFDAALATSGTVTLDCTVAGVPSVVGYRTDFVTAALAKRWLNTEHIALPNIIAKRRVFPELLQREVTGSSLAEKMELLLDDLAHYRRECASVREALALPCAKAPSRLVAEMLRSWLN
jgi:lipid-A-disaccharide synthase